MKPDIIYSPDYTVDVHGKSALQVSKFTHRDGPAIAVMRNHFYEPLAVLRSMEVMRDISQHIARRKYLLPDFIEVWEMDNTVTMEQFNSQYDIMKDEMQPLFHDDPVSSLPTLLHSR